MLVLARKEGERIRLNNNIVLTMLRVHGDKVRVGIEAPDDVLVLRDELETFHVVGAAKDDASPRAKAA